MTRWRGDSSQSRLSCCWVKRYRPFTALQRGAFVHGNTTGCFHLSHTADYCFPARIDWLPQTLAAVAGCYGRMRAANSCCRLLLCGQLTAAVGCYMRAANLPRTTAAGERCAPVPARPAPAATPPAGRPPWPAGGWPAVRRPAPAWRG